MQLVAEGRGRPKGSVKYSKDDADYIRNDLGFNGSTAMSTKIKATKHRYANLLANVGIEDDLSQKTLRELRSLLDAKGIDFKSSSRRKDWQVHEHDVVDGINTLFKSNVFKLKDASNELDIDTTKFKASSAGGGKQSDVKVENLHNKKFFFVECKLNFNAAEYFKYGLDVNGSQLAYDHHVYTDGIDEVVGKEQIDKINQLFEKEINISKFLNKVVNSKEVKATWKKFLDNAIAVEKFIEKSDEFKQFAHDKFQQKWPDDFKNFAKVFDTYCKFYIDKYNSLVDKLFLIFESDELDKDYFKIRSHKANRKDNAFKTIAILQMEIEEQHLKIFDQQAFDDLVSAILTIEKKLNALLQALGKSDAQISDLLELEDKHKTKYFFKLFISSVGRKRAGQDFNDLSEEDELGNMQLCSSVVMKTRELAEMITAFYVKKDHCAYIQIGDRIYQFDEKFNPFKLERLPIFKDILDTFAIRISISDDLSSIRLHISAIEPDKNKLNKFNWLSFKKNDKNFIEKEVDKIVI